MNNAAQLAAGAAHLGAPLARHWWPHPGGRRQSPARRGSERSLQLEAAAAAAAAATWPRRGQLGRKGRGRLIVFHSSGGRSLNARRVRD